VDRRLAVVLSALFLYLTGVLTGSFVGRLLASGQEERIERAVEELSNTYEKLFYDVLILMSEENSCSYLKHRIDELCSELGKIVRLLPERLEVSAASPSLLDKYHRLNIKAFLLASVIGKRCPLGWRPVIYIYRHGDLNAGLFVDRLKKKFKIRVFVTDAKTFREILRTDVDPPALYVCGRVVGLQEVNGVVECLGR